MVLLTQLQVFGLLATLKTTNNYDYDSVVVGDNPDESSVPTADINPESSGVLPATGNPLIIVLLALFALGTITLRRRK